MMASSRRCTNELKITVIMVFIFSLTFLPSNSAEPVLVRDGDHQGLKEQMEMVLGSSPPRCVKRCMGCIPCTPTLVASAHHGNNHLKAANTNQGDESYYLLSWKCKCRNKLFQP
ncbi:hypothetical protein CerSpe_263730 [Prunus speciosa]